MAFLHAVRVFLALLLTAFALFGLLLGMVGLPPGLPWTPLDLDAPIGFATPLKLARTQGAACRDALVRAGVRFRVLPVRTGDEGMCGYDDGVAWAPGGARTIAYSPASPPLACPLAAGLVLWERRIVQPAAIRLLGSRVAAIDHYGSYACRRLYGRATGAWSEHARAAAIDVAGFRLADGRVLTVARDWARADARGRFLHAVRDGACRIFATTLSPDYNAAHRDHLHLDAARRGGWTTCG